MGKFSGIQNIVRVQRQFDGLHGFDLRRIQLHLDIGLLGQSHTMFAGHGAVQVKGCLEHLLDRFVSLFLLPRDFPVDHHVYVDIAVPGTGRS